jgi:hypothetical protein
MPVHARIDHRCDRRTYVARVTSASALALALGAAAYLAAPPATGNFYAQATELRIVPGCSEIQCFRVLIPWVLGALPASTTLKWKAFDVACDVLAALAVFDLCLAFGLERKTATLALLLSAFGFGSLYALWETFTADPMMFWLAPVVTRWFLENRAAAWAALAWISVLAKEFVVMTVAMLGVAAAWQGDWTRARQAFGVAGVAFAIWIAVQAVLMRLFGYSYTGSATAAASRIWAGSYLAVWLMHLSPASAAAALYAELGALYLLAPVGWVSAPSALKRLTLAALPFAAFLAYVEQPDRALWNFHFLACPLAAIVLADASRALQGAFIAFYAAANLRVGAHIDQMPPARFAFAASALIAVMAIAAHRSHPRRSLAASRF